MLTRRALDGDAMTPATPAEIEALRRYVDWTAKSDRMVEVAGMACAALASEQARPTDPEIETARAALVRARASSELCSLDDATLTLAVHGLDALASLPALTARCEDLAARLVDCEALHLAGEQTIRNMQRRVEAAEAKVARVRMSLDEYMNGWYSGVENADGPTHYTTATDDYERGYLAGRAAYEQARRAEAARERHALDCPVCHGSGWWSVDDEPSKPCPQCHGTGQRTPPPAPAGEKE